MKKRWMTIGGLLATLVACAPTVQQFAPAEGAPALEENYLLLSDAGEKLPMRVWLPEKGKVRAAIVAVHGFNDYSNAFDSPGLYFAQQGIATYAYDQRGFGNTQGRGLWPGEQNLVADLIRMVRAVRSAQPGVPLYMLGESMGGAVVMMALADPQFPKVDGAILSAPAVWGDHTMNRFYRSVLWTAAHTVPWKQVSGKGLKILASDNLAMLREMGKDPLIIKRTRVDAIYGMVQLMDHAYALAPQIKSPLLLLYGQYDQVIPLKPIFEVADRLTTPYKLAYYPTGFHMLLRDLKAEVVMDDVVAWIEHPKGFLPSGYDLHWRALIDEEE